jgi:peptide/nickel transport system substrate-binding protein
VSSIQPARTQPRIPTGTGPFMFRAWRPGKDVVLVRNERYWGKKARLDRLVFRPIVDSLARVRALQRGTIHGLDPDLAYPGAVGTIKRNRNLKVLERPSRSVGWVAINQAIPPMDKLLVRQAIAYGLDRRPVVRSFYGGRAQLADQLMPPVFVGHAKRVKQYPFDPARSRALLRRAGLKLPVKVDFWYPTDVTRPSMLDPKRNFAVFTSNLERAGFEVVPHRCSLEPRLHHNLLHR